MQERIIKKDIGLLAQTKMYNYSLSVICGRQVADVRDGLKPVHRRILYTMLQEGYTPDKDHVKSARIVGTCMALYHPHGDASIYDAMVRQAQWFNNNVPLVDPHGNFGSISGDGAAANRYTEARMSRFAYNYLTQDIKKNAVDFTPSYDGTNQEPIVLPSQLPMLLVNGCSGIAAGGYMTEIPLHNLGEVCNLTIKLIDNPNLTVEQVATMIRPDFPTGGILCSNDAIKEAYITGRGCVSYRAKLTHETNKSGRDCIVITEIQYGSSIGGLMENIKSKCIVTKDNPNPPITEIHDIRDESAKGLVRLVIELKKDAQPAVVENKLYKHTRCQDTQKIIMLATKRDTFQQYNLKELIMEWIQFRFETLKRVFSFDIRQIQERVHILNGLLKAINNMDAIVETIRKCKNVLAAKESLMKKFDFSDMQANAILEIKLSRLVSLEKEKLAKEKEDSEARLNELRLYIKEPKRIYDLIKDQLSKIGATSKGRKTVCMNLEVGLEHEDIISDENWLISITKNKYIKRSTHTAKQQNRGGKGSSIGKTKDNDFVESMFYANSKDHLLCFTNKGRVFDIKVWQIEECTLQAIGRPIKSFIQLQPNETVETILCLSNEEYSNTESYLAFATKKGLVKKTSMVEYQNIRESGLIALRLKEDDSLLGVRYINPELQQDFFLATSSGFGIRFPHTELEPCLRPTYGVRGINLRPNDQAVSFEIIDVEQCYILSVASNGLGKKTLLDNPTEIKKGIDKVTGEQIIAIENAGFPNQKRDGKGRIVMSLKPDTSLVKALVAYDEQQLILLSSGGKIICNSTEDIRIGLRPSFGSRIMNINEDVCIVDAIIIRDDSDVE